MKNKLAFLLVVVCFTTLVDAQKNSKGIQFIEKHSLDSALKIAKETNKLVFVDCYTTWCGPCKMLTAQTFPDSALGVFFNKHFVSVKLDMEVPENKEMRKKYEVNVFPTLLFINTSGEIEHNAVGYMLPNDLIEVGKTALDTKRNSASLKRIILSGKYSPNELRAYLEMNMYGAKNIDLLKKYFEIQDPAILFSEKDLQFIEEYSGYKWHDDVLDFVWKNRDKYAQTTDKKRVEVLVVNALDNLVQASKDKGLEIEKFAKYGQEIQDILNARLAIRDQEKLLIEKKSDKEVWSKYFELVNKNLKIDKNANLESSTRKLVYRLSQDSTELSNVLTLVKKEQLENAKSFIEILKLSRIYYLVRKKLPIDLEIFKSIATDIKQYEYKPSVLLNTIAWSCFETSNDKVLLNYALKIAEQSVIDEKNENNLDTYALLHAKLGQFDSAIAIENDALECAQKNNNKKMIEVINKHIEKLQKAEVPGLKNK